MEWAPLAREAFLISLAVLVLEVAYTRVFSYKLVYYFTYVVVGIALLGVGAGGVFVAISGRLRRASAPLLVARCALAGAIAVGVGYLVAARTPLNLFTLVLALGEGRWSTAGWESAKLMVVGVGLFAPFLCAGVALAVVFSRATAHIGRLYAADLAGAGLGCALVIPAITHLTPPGCVMLAGAVLALAGIPGAGAWSTASGLASRGLAVLLAAAALWPNVLPDPVPDLIKERHPALFSRWSPVFRVDVVPAPGMVPPTHFLVHDGTLGSVINQWDGDVRSLGRYDTNERSIPFRLLERRPRVVIIGSAGGNEIMASLHYDAADVTGIELNPVTVSLLTTHFADFTGRLAEHPRVRIVTAEGRSFLQGSGERFDLIWLVAPDSYAAMNAATSGAFVLSESYLYTHEMILEALAHLTPGGILCAQFGEIDFEEKPNRTLRYLATARGAFASLGVPDFARHVLVATSPGFGRLGTATILLRREAFTAPDVERLRAAVAAVPGSRVVHDGTVPAALPVEQVITLPPDELGRWLAAYPFSVGPISDDAPFFWSFVRFRDVLLGSPRMQPLNVEEGIGERLLLLFVAFAAAFAAMVLLVPLAALRGTRTAIPHKLSAGIYFAALGMGFMFLEICLIQKLTLYLGYPTHSLTVTLFALLVSTGAGSLLSERVPSPARAVLLAFVGAALLVAIYRLALGPLVAHTVGWPFAARVAVAIGLLAPLGVCLGVFMPLGLRRIAELGTHGDAAVAWCWAVNAFVSVISSVLATILSVALGFDRVMLIGLAVYTLGVLAFMRLPAAAPSRS